MAFVWAVTQKILSFLILFLVLIGTSTYAGGDEEDQLLNIKSCGYRDLSNTWLEETDLRKVYLTSAKLTGADLSNVRLRSAN